MAWLACGVVEAVAVNIWFPLESVVNVVITPPLSPAEKVMLPARVGVVWLAITVAVSLTGVPYSTVVESTATFIVT
jgi:hypothetical protein